MCNSSSFSAINGEVQFRSFFPSLVAHGTKIRRVIALVFGTLGDCLMMYSNWMGRIFWWRKGRKAKPVGLSRTRVRARSAGPFICSRTPKIADFSKTGSRNMAKKCAIDSSYPTSYSTSIVLWGLRAFLLPVLRRERWQTTGQWRFFASLVARATKEFQLKSVFFVSRARCT